MKEIGSRCIIMTMVILAVVLMLSLPGCHAQEKISLQSKVDKSTITIGDLITYTVIVTRDTNMKIQLPSLGANLGGFEIRDYKVHEPQTKDGRTIDQFDYIISTFDTGEFEIPPVEIKYSIPPAKDQKILKTESIKIIVASMKPSESGDIREIKPPWEILYNWRPVIIIGSIALGVLIIVGVIIYLIRRKRRLGAILPQWVPPPRPAHEIAYERLKQLAESSLLANGEIKEYYSEISEILRQYVEGRWGVFALELTSFELLDKLRTVEIPRECMPVCEQFLALCDFVKFAKYIPGDAEHNAVINWALQFVDMTKVVKKVETGSSETTDKEPPVQLTEEPTNSDKQINEQ